MRRLALLAAVCLGFSLPVMVPSVALASQTDTTCQTVFQDDTVHDQVCIGARIHGLNGGGWELDEVDISILGGGWNSTAVNCNWLKGFNDTGVARWEKDGNACDVTSSGQVRTYFPAVNYPNSTTVTVQWSGTAQLSFAPDQSFKVRVILP